MADNKNNFTKRAKTRADFNGKDWENVEKVRKAFGDEAADQIGTFKEYAGGGKPLKRGQKAPSKKWVEENRVMQPRDEDGKFTYNAVNSKELKDGPSRGTTVSPILRGKGFSSIYAEQEAVTVNPNNRQKVIVKMGVSDFVDAFREFKQDRGYGFDTSTKKGRYSQDEESARRLAKALNKTVPCVKNASRFNRAYGTNGPNSGGSNTQPNNTQPNNKPNNKPNTQTNNTQSNNTQANVSQDINSSQDFDANLAKNDKEKFISDNYDKLNDFMEAAEKKGFEVDLDVLIDEVSNGNIKNFNELYDILNNG